MNVDTPDPECILQQKGQGPNPKFLVRFRVKPDGGMYPDKWIKAVLVPAPLVVEWRRTHRNDGVARKRREKRQQDPDLAPNPEVEDLVEGIVSEEVELEMPARHISHKLVPTRRLSQEESAPPALQLRRSSRNVPRVDYREFDASGYV